MTESNDSIFTVHRYYQPVNQDFEGNPLITYLPPLTRLAVKELVSSPIAFSVSDREAPADVRIQYLNRLLRFIAPTEQQVNFAYSLYSMIMQSYSAVNPVAPDAQSRFNEMCEALAANAYVAADDLSLFRSPLCITLIGTPGCGKSRIVELLLDKLSSGGCLFRHPQHKGIFQKLHAVVQAPKTRHQKSLAWCVYDELYAAFLNTGAKRARLSYQSNSGASIGREVAVLAKTLNLGVLVIEEIQHVVHLRKGVDQDSLEFLTTLVNAVRMPVLLIGTWKAVALLRSEMRLSRRTTTPASDNFCRFKAGPEWEDLVLQVLHCQYVRNPIMYSDELAAFLYELTQGVPDVLIKLVVLTQLEAIRGGTETVDRDGLQACSDRHLTYLAPTIAYLRTGINESDEQLWDVEPADFEAYYARLAAECIESARSRSRIRDSALSATIKASKVANALVAADAASAETATVIAREAVTETPSASVAAITKRALARMTQPSLRPSASPKRAAEIDKAFEALDDRDIRKIVYKAQRSGSDVQADLAAAGHLRPVHLVMPL